MAGVLLAVWSLRARVTFLQSGSVERVSGKERDSVIALLFLPEIIFVGAGSLWEQEGWSGMVANHSSRNVLNVSGVTPVMFLR